MKAGTGLWRVYEGGGRQVVWLSATRWQMGSVGWTRWPSRAAHVLSGTVAVLKTTWTWTDLLAGPQRVTGVCSISVTVVIRHWSLVTQEGGGGG